MKIRNQKTAPSLETMEAFLDEIVEYYTPFEKLYRKLKARKRGSEAYLDLLGDLEVAVLVLKTKAGTVTKIIDENIEAMPDDDEVRARANRQDAIPQILPSRCQRAACALIIPM